MVNARQRQGRLVQVQAASLQIAAVPIVGDVTDHVVQPPAAVAEVCKRQPHVTLALVGCIVHRHQQPLASGAAPRKTHEAVVASVAVPGRCAVEQLPLAIAHGRLTQHGKQPFVELLQPLVDRFLRTSHQMGRDPCPAPLELSLVKETQTGGQERDDSGRLVHVRRERRRRPRLVVVFHEAGQLVLIVEPGVEMLAHRPGVALAEAVVQAFVVGVIESLLLHRPFAIPVDLRHELEVRMVPPHGLDGLRPERLRPDAPRAFEDVGQDQHGHVAAHAVALPGDPHQFADHRLLQLRVAIIELQRVGPAVEVRVPAVRQHQRPVVPWARGRSCCGEQSQIVLAARDEVVRVLVDPRVIRGHVVGDEVEHQLQSACVQPLAQTCERRVAAQVAMDRVVLDREA